MRDQALWMALPVYLLLAAITLLLLLGLWRRRQEILSDEGRWLDRLALAFVGSYLILLGFWWVGQSSPPPTPATPASVTQTVAPANITVHGAEPASAPRTQRASGLVSVGSAPGLGLDDLVLAPDAATGLPGIRRVVAVARTRETHRRVLVVKPEEEQAAFELITTDAQPLWVDKKGWLPARGVAGNDRVVFFDGRRGRVARTSREERPEGVDLPAFTSADDYHRTWRAQRGAPGLFIKAVPVDLEAKDTKGLDLAPVKPRRGKITRKAYFYHYTNGPDISSDYFTTRLFPNRALVRGELALPNYNKAQYLLVCELAPGTEALTGWIASQVQNDQLVDPKYKTMIGSYQFGYHAAGGEFQLFTDKARVKKVLAARFPNFLEDP
jgi:hypothetical protein